MVGSDDPFLLGFGLFSESKCEFQGVYPEDLQNDATRSSKRLFQDMFFFFRQHVGSSENATLSLFHRITLGCCGGPEVNAFFVPQVAASQDEQEVTRTEHEVEIQRLTLGLGKNA